MIAIMRTKLIDPDGLTVEVELRDQVKEDVVNAMSELKADLLALGYKPISQAAAPAAPFEIPTLPATYTPLTPHGLLLLINSGLRTESKYSSTQELFKTIGQWPDFKNRMAVQSAAEKGIKAKLSQAMAN